MVVFKCKICGGTLEINAGETVATCEYCGTKQTLPKLDDEKKANLFDRANHFRRNNDFDKAMGIYEQILNEDTEDAESYWSIVLCRYGIEYVEDPSSRKRVPTVNRAQFTSVFDDEDYKSAIKYADSYQKNIYEAEAAIINEIQKGILAISQKEEPFDVFICYKETDNNGRRTQDSVLATELYHELTKEGFKVFFSRITLEDKLGVAYEPYIFAALHSAKVMVALGTKPEHFNAVWVKNEWSRYLSLIKNGANKILIPAYRDMDPYDLPEEFSHLQAQDMSKLGFMQDLVRGIKKLVSAGTSSSVKETVVVQSTTSGNAAALVKRGFLALEDGEWKKADEFFEQALNQNAEDAQAYLGKLMAELNISKKENLKNCKEPFDNNTNYEKILRFGNKAEVSLIKDCIDFIKKRNEDEKLAKAYAKAFQTMNTASTEEEFKLANKLFGEITDYKDSAALAEQCLEKAEVARKDEILAKGKSKMNGEVISDYESAIKLFESISGWKDADEKAYACQKKIEEIKAKDEADRLERERQAEIERKEAERIAKRNKKSAIIATPIVIATIVFVIVANTIIIPRLKFNAAVKLLDKGAYDKAYTLFEQIGETNIVNESKYDRAIKLLDKSDLQSAIVLLQQIDYKDSREKLLEICRAYEMQIAAGAAHTVRLKANGTVVAVGDNDDGQCEVSDWTDIVAISADSAHTVGLKANGTVVAVGNNDNGQCDVSDWTDIVAISTGSTHTVGLKKDGSVVSTEYIKDSIYTSYRGQCDVSDWTDIVAISAGFNHTVGLKADGTVVAVGDNDDGQCEVSDWTDIVAISADFVHTVGLKADGTVVSTPEKSGLFDHGQHWVSGWKDIIAISAGSDHTVGLKADGTVVSTVLKMRYDGDTRTHEKGYWDNGQDEVSNWKNIVAISTDYYHTVGLKADGTVVAVGVNDDGQCEVSDWTNIE